MNAKEQVRLARQALRTAEQALERERRSRFGDDVHPVGTVLRFDKSFASGETYPYAAIKTNDGYWRTCGPTAGGKAWTWDELVSWFNSGTPVKHVFVANDPTKGGPSYFGELKGYVEVEIYGTPITWGRSITLDFELPRPEYDSLSILLFGPTHEVDPMAYTRRCEVHGCLMNATRHTARCAGHV